MAHAVGICRFTKGLGCRSSWHWEIVGAMSIVAVGGANYVGRAMVAYRSAEVRDDDEKVVLRRQKPRRNRQCEQTEAFSSKSRRETSTAGLRNCSCHIVSLQVTLAPELRRVENTYAYCNFISFLFTVRWLGTRPDRLDIILEQKYLLTAEGPF